MQNRMIKILFITIDPLENRQRLLNHIQVAANAGMEVQVMAPGRKGQLKREDHPSYRVQRIFLKFEKGPFKFIQFNLHIFFHLLFNRYRFIQARGLWTLPGVLFSGAIRKSQLIYDAHEFFAGLGIFDDRPLRRAIWMWIEKKAIPYTKFLITVSEPIADLYRERYIQLSQITVIRNLPRFQIPSLPQSDDLKLNMHLPVILFHGYFMPHRGLEQLIRAMNHIPDAILLLVGGGSIEQLLRNLAAQLNLTSRIVFRDFIPNENLIDFVSQAYIGVSLLEPVSDNHRYALPNKFFEYIMAGVPVLTSNIPTLSNYVNRYEVGRTVDPSDPAQIAREIQFMLTETTEYDKWKVNCQLAANELNWEKESRKLEQWYKAL